MIEDLDPDVARTGIYTGRFSDVVSHLRTMRRERRGDVMSGPRTKKVQRRHAACRARKKNAMARSESSDDRKGVRGGVRWRFCVCV